MTFHTAVSDTRQAYFDAFTTIADNVYQQWANLIDEVFVALIILDGNLAGYDTDEVG